MGLAAMILGAVHLVLITIVAGSDGLGRRELRGKGAKGTDSAYRLEFLLDDGSQDEGVERFALFSEPPLLVSRDIP